MVVKLKGLWVVVIVARAMFPDSGVALWVFQGSESLVSTGPFKGRLMSLEDATYGGFPIRFLVTMVSGLAFRSFPAFLAPLKTQLQLSIEKICKKCLLICNFHKDGKSVSINECNSWDFNLFLFK